MGISVLGPLTVNGSGRLGRRDRVVLGSLATRPGHPVSADQLADALWGERPPASAGKVLQGCVVRIRKVLGREAVQTSPHGYVLHLPTEELDSLRFEDQVGRARELLTLGEADRAAYLLTNALALWHGEAFADLEDWEPALAAGRRLSELRREAEELRVEAHLRSGRHREVLSEAQALVRAAPLREHRWGLLARAQYQSGQQGEALRTIQQLKGVLVEHLGIDPGPDVMALEQSILRQDVSLLVADAPTPSAMCPWLGLRAYGVEDADWFFGRDIDVATCLEILARTSVLALVGPSGSGKSSLLRAGVGAALRRRRQASVTITPGAHPMQSLSALVRAPRGAALLVDQCEELFSLCEDTEEQQEFLRALAAEATNRIVAVAMRADRLADLTANTGFSRLVERGMYLVGGLGEDGLRTAVETPARQAGLVIEPGLVDLLVREVANDRGALPLMSHALLETWKRREGNTLTVAGYRATGGINGAVAQSAEVLYSRVDTERRHLLRDLVLRLVSPGPQGEPVRTKVSRRLIGNDPEHDQLIEMLVAARLVTSDDGALEITHEALARAWPRLRGWLEDDVEGQRIRHHLSAAADAWDTLGRPVSELYRGVRLARVLEWENRSGSTLTPVEREFLDAARSNAEAEEQSAVERARAQARLIHRLRVVLVGAACLLVLALIAGILAAVQSDRANENAAQAEQSAVSALARGAAARGTSSGDLDTALLLGIAGVVLDESPETVGNLQEILTRNPALIRSTPLTGNETLALDVHPDGRTAALLDTDYLLKLVDLSTGEELARRQIGASRGEKDTRRALRFSPDGRVVAVGAAAYSDPLVRVLDSRTLEPVDRQPTHPPRGAWRVVDLEFSQKSTTMAAVLQRLESEGEFRVPQTTRAYVWALGSRAEPKRIDLSRRAPEWASASLSPDGGLLYTADPTVRVHDLRSGSVRTLLEQEPEPGYTEEVGIDVSPDGRRLAVARGPIADDVLILDAATGRVRHTLPTNQITFDAHFSADGHRLMTVSWIGLDVSVWDARSGAALARFTVPEGSNRSVALAGAGSQVVTASTSESLRRWDVDARRRYLRRVPVGGLPWNVRGGACTVATSSDGAYVAYTVCPGGAGPEQTGLVLDVARGTAYPERAAGSGYNFGGGSWYAPRAEYLRAEGGTIYVWNGRSGRVRAGPHPVGDRVTEVDHSPDGSRVVISELSGTLTLLDGSTLEPVGKPVDVGGNVCCVALGPDNRTAFALVGGPERTFFWDDAAERYALVDLEQGRIVHEGALGLDDGVWAAYAADGRHVAAGGLDGEVAIIDTATGSPVRPPVRAHGDTVYWVASSSDGSRLVSGAGDGSVVIWDVETGEVEGRVTLPDNWPSSPAFRDDGSVLIVPWHVDPALYIWDPSAARAVEFACRAVGRDLTEAEWAEHFPGQPYQSVCPTT